MKHDEFVGEVQHRAELGSRGEAIRVIRATLMTLGERLQPGEASDLAAVLPMEIDFYLQDADSGQIFDRDEFVDRVAQRARAERGDAYFFAQVVLDVTAEATPESEFDDVTAQLPAEYDELFELVGDDEYYE